MSLILGYMMSKSALMNHEEVEATASQIRAHVFPNLARPLDAGSSLPP